MISVDLARALRTAGVRWRPVAGDAFRIERGEFESDVFTVSDMTIEAHEYPSGIVLGFNGTTEWALDSVALEDSLWLPREDQLRELLRGTFRSLVRRERDDGRVAHAVEIVRGGRGETFEADEAVDAYAEALLTLVTAAQTDSDDVDEAVEIIADDASRWGSGGSAV